MSVAASEDTKTCPRCGDPKPAAEFYVDRRRRDGLSCYCKTCAREYDNDRGPRELTTMRVIRRFAYRRAERDMRRLYPTTFEAFYAGHVAAGVEAAARCRDQAELTAALRALNHEDDQ